MKKLFYLAVILCFVQVGISKAQTTTGTDKKMESVSSMKSPGSDVQSTTVQTNNPSVKNSEMQTSTTATKETGTPSCCQKKGGSCCGGMTGTTSTKQCDAKKHEEESSKHTSDKAPK